MTHLIAAVPHVFDGENYLEAALPDGAEAFSLTFWISVRGGRQREGRWACLFQKGASINEQCPAAFFLPHTLTMRCTVATSFSDYEGLDTTDPLEEDAWVHVAFVFGAQRLQIYVNGELNSETRVRGTLAGNTGPLYIGSSPWCPGVACSMRLFAYHGEALDEGGVFQSYLAGLDETVALAATAQRKADKTPTSPDKKLSALDQNHVGEMVGPVPVEFHTLFYVKREADVLPDVSLEFSVSMWVNLTQEPTRRWRNLFQRGRSDEEKAPAVWLKPRTLHLSLGVATKYSPHEHLDSASEIPLNKWTHIVCTVRKRRLAIYINGSLDAESLTQGLPSHPTGAPAFVGKTNWCSGIRGWVARSYLVAFAMTPDDVARELGEGPPPAPVRRPHPAVGRSPAVSVASGATEEKRRQDWVVPAESPLASESAVRQRQLVEAVEVREQRRPAEPPAHEVSFQDASDAPPAAPAPVQEAIEAAAVASTAASTPRTRTPRTPRSPHLVQPAPLMTPRTAMSAAGVQAIAASSQSNAELLSAFFHEIQALRRELEQERAERRELERRVRLLEQER